jgi:uncharacterized protein (DUF1697 family)
MKLYLALLRGINVSGKNIILKQDLQALFYELGCKDVKTYIQSGNVIFKTEKQNLKGLAEIISAKIKETFDYNVPVVIKTKEDMHFVIQSNPFLKEEEVNLKQLYVFYLNKEPKETINLLNYNVANNQFVIKKNIVYVKYNLGASRSKLSNSLIEKKLSVISTARNWGTTTKLLDLMEKE